MQHKEELTGKEKFVNALANFIQNNKIILGAILGLLLIIIVGGMILNDVQNKRVLAEITAVEEFETEYKSSLSSEDKEAELSELADNIETYLTENNLTDWPNQRVYFLMGTISFELNLWKEAAENFETAAEIQESYLTGLSLYNGAVAWEAFEDNTKAIALLENLQDLEGLYPEKPHGLFTMGRLYEKEGQNEAAIAAYSRLETDYPNSDWTKLAKARIIKLQ